MNTKLILIGIMLFSFQVRAEGLVILSNFTKGDVLVKTDRKTYEVVADTTSSQQRLSGITKIGQGQYLIAGQKDAIYKYDIALNTIETFYFHTNLYSVSAIAANNENDIFLVRNKTAILRVKDFNLMPNTSAPYIYPTLGACNLSGDPSIVLNNNTLLATSSGSTNKILVYDVSKPSAECLQSYILAENLGKFSKIIRHSDDIYFVGDTKGKVYRFVLVDNVVTDMKPIFTDNLLLPVKSMTENASKNILVSFTGGGIAEIDIDGNLINHTYLESVFTHSLIDLITY